MKEIKQMKFTYNTLLEKIKFLKFCFKYNDKIKDFNLINKKLELMDSYSKKNVNLSMLKKKNELQTFINDLKKIENDLKLITELFEFITQYNCIEDNELITEFKERTFILNKKLEEFELKQVFCKKYDYFNCYLDIQAGSGGVEAQDWANMILKMYLKWADIQGFNVKILDISEGDVAGIKSATIKVLGVYACGWLRTESGIHRLIRKSPFNANNKRHTSFSSVFVYPEINENINVLIRNKDIKIDVCKSSGAGGQHVNKTESAVRITHLPTNTVVKCQSDRSQHRNKENAIKQLKSKLYKLELSKKFKKKQDLENSKPSICWSNQIRSYFLDSSLVKDMRTGIKTNNVQSVLDGNLNEFIKASLRLEIN